MEMKTQAYQTYDFDENEIFKVLCNLMEKLTGDCSEDMIRLILQYVKENKGAYWSSGLQTPSALAIGRYRDNHNRNGMRQEFNIINPQNWKNPSTDFRQFVFTNNERVPRDIKRGDKHFTDYSFFKSRGQEYMIMKKIFGNIFSTTVDYEDYSEYGGNRFHTIGINDYYDDNSLVRRVENDTYGFHFLNGNIPLGDRFYPLKALRTKFKRTKMYELKPFDFVCFALLNRFYQVKKGLFMDYEGKHQYEKVYAKMRHGLANNKDILAIMISRFIKYRVKIQYFDIIRNLCLIDGYGWDDGYTSYKRKHLQANIRKKDSEAKYEIGRKILFDVEEDEEPNKGSNMGIRKMLELINRDRWWQPFDHRSWCKKDINEVMSKKNVLINLEVYNKECLRGMKIPYVKSWNVKRLWGAFMNEGHKETLLKLRKKFNKCLKDINNMCYSKEISP